MLLIMLLMALFAPQTGCTNDEGDEDIDVITPTDDESEGLLIEEMHSEND